MKTWIMSVGLAILLSGGTLLAAPAPAEAPKAPPDASSRISAVTVYQSNALVTREVDVPAGPGVIELVVPGLPSSTVGTSLFSEGGEGLRILTTRYRTRVVRENTQEAVRKLESEIKDLAKADQETQRQIQVTEQNLALLAKLENFTAGALQHLTEKGMLNADAITTLSKFIMDERAAKAGQVVALQQKLAASQEQAQFLRRQISETAAGSDKTIREAIVVVENENGAVGKVTLNYLVTAAAWRPQYKVRAGKDNGQIQLEYLAAIRQQSGEDWSNVRVTLSTAEPMLNAAPPELAMLEVGTIPVAQLAQVSVNGGTLGASVDNRVRSQSLRREGQKAYNVNKDAQGWQQFNDAAALEQAEEIASADFDKARFVPPAAREGQSVTFHLERALSIPWRDDEQLIEVARIDMKPDWFYKAVPVLTSHVYRLAKVTNESQLVILPGEATMYLGSDFVGRATLPLVAIGEQFTAGFGVDPQLQVARQLVNRTKSIQGGNQVLTFDYRITINSYKPRPVKLEVWDRMPHSQTEAVNVSLLSVSQPMSADPAYERDEKPVNLLRWDLTVEPTQRGEKAAVLTYRYKLEFAREAAIGKFQSIDQQLFNR